MTKWLADINGNKCSVAFWGSETAAQTALDSLVNCKNCINCSGCSDCSGCWGCSGCERCSRCSDCSGCSSCSDCSDCWNCSDCSRCSGCSSCSSCSDCSRCSDCSDCSGCSGQQHIVGDFTPPKIPVIADIHRQVFAAVSQPDALNMLNWHLCSTTHCRAGWVVHLAGEPGYALERFHNTALAAQLIYKASGYEINPGRFYDTNENAMADMAKLADVAGAERVLKDGE